MANIEIAKYVTTVDGKRYRLGEEDTPKLWAVELRVRALNPGTVTANFTMRNPTKEIVFVERSVLEKHGLVPVSGTDRDESPEPTRTAEDLILELLEHVGVYPEGGSPRRNLAPRTTPTESLER